jgi:hypothetical protein
MSRARGRPRIEREIRITPVRRDEIDIRRLARALLALAQLEETTSESEEAKELHDETS